MNATVKKHSTWALQFFLWHTVEDILFKKAGTGGNKSLFSEKDFFLLYMYSREQVKRHN